MSQAPGAPFTSDQPVKTENSDYPLQDCADYNLLLSRPGVPNGAGVGDILPPTTQGLAAEYPLCDTPVNFLGPGNGMMEYMDLDPLFQNTLSGEITPGDTFQYSLNVPPFIESPPSSEETDPGNIRFRHPTAPPPPSAQLPHHLPQLPIHSQLHPPYIRLPPNSRQRMRFDTDRRHSAPDCSAHEVEQRIKHLNRRVSHNAVEKRYRVNLNSKFKRLDEVVLQGMDPSFDPDNAANSDGLAQQDGDNSRTQPPKAQVIDSALNYIATLQREVKELKRRLGVYEPRGLSLQEHAAEGLSLQNATSPAQNIMNEHTALEDEMTQ